MLLIRTILLLSLSASLGAYRLYPGRPARTKWLVQRTSSIKIAGSTNINKFCCHVNEYAGPDTITLNSGVSVGMLSVDIADFSCNNNMMSREFKNTLKYKQYPQLKIVFVSLEKMPAFTAATETIKGCVEVALAGVSRKFDITYTSCRIDGENVELVGCRLFGFSDFGLSPPTKMGGLIRVNDRLDVEFKLHLRQII